MTSATAKFHTELLLFYKESAKISHPKTISSIRQYAYISR